MSLLLAYGADVNLAESPQILLPGATSGGSRLGGGGGGSDRRNDGRGGMGGGVDEGLLSQMRMRPTALHVAAAHGHLECLHVLLEHGADVNRCDAPTSPLARTAKGLQTAAWGGRLDASAVSQGMSCDKKFAIRWGGGMVLERGQARAGSGGGSKAPPVAHGEAEVEYSRNGESLGLTSLHIASAGGHVECLLMLMGAAEGELQRESSSGAWGNVRREGGRTDAGKDQSLYLRHGEKRWPHVLQQLKPHLKPGAGGVRARAGGVGAEKRDGLGRTCMHWAALAGSEDTVEVLLRSGLSVLTEDQEGDSALHLVCRSRNLECVKLVAAAAARQCGARLGAWEAGGDHGSSGAGRVGGGRMPMDVAGRVSKVSGRTPLHHAAQAGDCEGVELLLESKAPQVSEKRGLTPLHVAVARRDEQLGIVQTLLAHMADDAAQVNAADEQEMTPLHHAVACGRLATVETLLAVRGIEVDARDRYGRTPMMLAAARGDENLVLALITAGVCSCVWVCVCVCVYLSVCLSVCVCVYVCASYILH